MSDNTAGTPHENESEPQPVTPVTDALTTDAVPEPAPANEEGQGLIEPGAAPEAETEAAEAPAPEPVVSADADEHEAPKKAHAPADDETDGDEDAGAASEPENKKKWYAIKVQSGREDTIRAAILRKVAIEGLEDVFGQIMIPFEEVIEKKAVRVKDKKTGEYTTQEKKVTRKRKKFQGYIFAELEFNDRILYLIRETSGVGDFLKLRNKPNEPPTPEPMTDAEVKQMLGEKVGPAAGTAAKIKVEFEKGDRVRIREGSFKDSEGEVKDITLPKDPTDPPKITVVVTFWGRPLDVELEYWQVVKA